MRAQSPKTPRRQKSPQLIVTKHLASKNAWPTVCALCAPVRPSLGCEVLCAHNPQKVETMVIICNTLWHKDLRLIQGDCDYAHYARHRC